LTLAPGARVSCPTCAAGTTVHAFRQGGFSYRRCGDCDTLFVEVDLADSAVHEHYNAAYFESARSQTDERHGYASYRASQASMAKGFASRVALIRRFVSSGNLFEAGAAYGFFLKAAESHFDCTGIDVSAHAADTARREYGAHVMQGDVERVPFANDTFDVAAMWDVIEHLIHPVAALKEVRRVLKPGGYLFVSTDDASSWLPRLLGRRWWALAPPLHLCHFSRKSLRAACALAGLEPPTFFSDPRYYSIPEVITHFGESYRNATLKALGSRLDRTGLARLPIRVTRPEQFVAAIRKPL
jgi:SAM-dependent methyltransferase